MVRFYSLFVTDDDLLASPYIRRFNIFHDITIHRGKTEIVNFLLQAPLSKKQRAELSLVYDPHELNILNINVRSYDHQTILTVKMMPKEVGSVRIGFSYPQKGYVPIRSTNKIISPLKAVFCSNLAGNH